MTVGQYGPEVVLNGSILSPLLMAATAITVKNPDNSAATLYTDTTGTTTLGSNIVTTDSRGNLTFFAAAGPYKLVYSDSVGSQSLTVIVYEDAADLSATFSAILTPVTGETTTAQTARVNAALSAASAFGTRKIIRLVGDFTQNAPYIIPSRTTLDANSAKITQASGTNLNMLQNAAIATQRFVLDGAITAASTTLTSATAAFVAGDVGKEVVVWDAGHQNAPLMTTIASVTNATTAVLALAASSTVTAMALSIGNRDKDIVIDGGVWDHNGNTSGDYTFQRHMMRLQHLDGLRVRNASLIGVTAGYGLNPTDATDFVIDTVNVECRKGQIQPTGPLWRGRISNITGWQADDFVALVCYDWPGISACAGPISDILVENITPRSAVNFVASAAVKLLAGSPYWMRRVTVDHVVGASQGAPVKLGDDGAFASTTNSKMQAITIRDVKTKITDESVGATFPLVEIAAGPTSDIRGIVIDGLHWTGHGVNAGLYANAVSVFNVGAVGGVIQDLKISNLTVEEGQSYVNAVSISRVRVKRLVIDGLRMPVAGTSCRGMLVNDADSIVDSAVIHDAAVVLAGSGVLAYTQSGATLTRLVVSDSDVQAGLALFQSASQTSPRTLLAISNTHSTASNLVSAASPFDLDATNTTHDGTGEIISTPYIGADGSTIFGRIRNPSGRSKLVNAGSAAVLWTEPQELFAYTSTIGDILALTPALWVRPETLGTLANNAPVPTWPDSSGLNRSLSQATSGQRPLYKTAQQNGLAAVVFDGTDDWLTRAAFPLSDPIVNVFLVARLDAAGSYGDLLSYAGTELEIRHLDATRQPEVATAAGSATSATALALASWHQWSVTADDTANTEGLWIDGSSVATGAHNFAHQAAATLALGSRTSGVSVFGGAIGECLVIPGALTTAERQSVESYLKTKWATP